MNRLLISAALAALVAGCARPAVSESPYSGEGYYPPVETTVVVREMHFREPVVYTDTVYLPAEEEYSDPVYVENEYNQYNEYNEYNEYEHNDMYVHVSEPRPPSQTDA